MKIMHVIESSATGTLSVVLMLANNQIKENNDVCVVFSTREDTPKNITSLFDKRITLAEIDMGMKKFPLSCFFLQKEIKKNKPDIVHLHSSLAGFIGRLSNIGNKNSRIIYSPHCISFMRKDIGKVKELIFKVLERTANLIPSTYVACSKSEYLSIKKNLTVKRVEVVNNAYDGEVLFQSSMLTSELKSKKKIKVITVGGVRNQKDPASFAQLAERFSGTVLEFIWVGDGDKNLKHILNSAGVTVTGWLSKKDVLCLLTDADIYVSTAQWEGMPISILEAMATGLPVVAKNCAGNNDLVEHGKNGYLFDNLEDAIVVIKMLIESDIQRDKIILSAIDSIRKEYSLKDYTEKIKNVYERSLKF